MGQDKHPFYHSWTFFFAHPSVINVGNQDLDGSILCSDVRPFPIPIWTLLSSLPTFLTPVSNSAHFVCVPVSLTMPVRFSDTVKRVPSRPHCKKREAAAASSPFFLRIWMRKRLGRRVSSACEISSTFLSCRPNYEVLYLKMVYDSQIVASFPTPLQLIVHASQLFDCTPEVRLL